MIAQVHADAALLRESNEQRALEHAELVAQNKADGIVSKGIYKGQAVTYFDDPDSPTGTRKVGVTKNGTLDKRYRRKGNDPITAVIDKGRI